jgi:hypothetical protein
MNLTAGVSLLFPGVAVGVVAVAFPETELMVVEEREAANPLDGFPGVEMRNDQAAGAAVFGGERLAIMIESKEHVGMEEIGERDVGGVAFFGED